MSSKEWQCKKWGDITTLEYGKALRDYKDRTSGVPVFGTNGQIGYTDKALYNSSGVIVGRKGAYRGIHYSNEPFSVIDTAFYLKPIMQDAFDMKWAYYELLTKDINSMDSGSAIPSTSRNDFYALPVSLPAIEEQRTIAATLSALDDKIELNNRINKTLEEMAQALFKQWFVDFEFPDENGQPYKSYGGEMEESELGLIPKGWKVGCIGNYAKIKSGFAFKSSWWQASGVPVIKIKEISDATINFNNVSFVAEDKIQTAKEFYVTGGELLIAMTGATIGKFALVPKIKQGALVNQRVGKFFLGNSPLEKAGFLYCLLKKEEIFNEIVSRGDGSAQPNISPTAIETIKIVYPSELYILQFNHAVYSSFKMIISNKYENSNLEKLLDTLLPKLMSGEIRVPIEEVAADV